MTKRFTDRKEFFHILRILSLPIVLQNLISTSVNLIDTLMVSELGGTAVAAVGLGNQIFFILMLFLFGLCSGASVFIAQFWGKKDTQGIHDSLGLAIAIAIPVALTFSALVIFIPESLLRIFTDDPELLAAGVRYLPITGITYVCMAVSMQFSSALRSVEKVKYPFYSSSIALGFNVIFNYIFIFGLGPIPAMGVFGAGLATSMARLLELMLMLAFAYGKKTAVALPLRSLYKFNKSYIPKFFKVALPVFSTEALWGIGSTVYFAVYGRMGTDVIAAVNIAKIIENFCLVFFWSLAGAASITIGKSIGENNIKKAHKLANSFSIFGLFVGIIVGTLLYFVSPYVLSLFHVEPSVIEISALYLSIFCLFLWMRGGAPILTVGILRAGGDTTFAFLIDTLPMWLISIPLAWLCGVVWELPIWTVFLAMMSYDLLRIVPAFIRMQGNKWIKNLVHSGE